MPSAKDTEGVQAKEEPVRPLATVMTVCRLPDLPFFRVIVTGPWALDQVRVKAWPAVRVPKSLLVNFGWARATTKAEAARRAEEKRILLVLVS